MSERYLKLFTLPENLYAEGSPAIIVAGALHKDNQTGEIFAQLKFQNIQDKVIKAISVSFTTFDSFGNQLDEPQEFQYLDLDFKRNYVYGNKVPVRFSNPNVRSYSVKIRNVAFSDGSFVTPTSDVYDTLPKQKYLIDVLGNSDLVKQYALDVGNADSVFEPLKHKDLWLCACGVSNRVGEACYNCHATYDCLTNLDVETLEQNCQARLEEEARQAEISRKNALLADGMRKFNLEGFEVAIEVFKQIPGWADADEMIVKCQNAIAERQEKAKAYALAQKIKRKRRIKVSIGIFASLLVTAAMVAYIIFAYMPKLNIYNQAVARMEKGLYKEAIADFNEIIEFKDSETQIENCNTAIKQRTYDNAVSLMESGSYEEAINTFVQVIEFKDSEIQIENCNTAINELTYDTAINLMNKARYKKAMELFEDLGDYSDSKEKIIECQSAMYAYVQKNYNNSDTTTYSYLKELKSSKYLDSAELYEELYAWKATIVVNSTAGDYKTDKSSIKRGKSVYFNITLSGGTPGAKTKLCYTITYPNGNISELHHKHDSMSNGYSTHIGLLTKSSLGTYKITVYDGDNNVIGTHSVKIVK